MNGIQFLSDDRGNRAAAVIHLKKHCRHPVGVS